VLLMDTGEESSCSVGNFNSSTIVVKMLQRLVLQSPYRHLHLSQCICHLISTTSALHSSSSSKSRSSKRLRHLALCKCWCILLQLRAASDRVLLPCLLLRFRRMGFHDRAGFACAKSSNPGTAAVSLLMHNMRRVLSRNGVSVRVQAGTMLQQMRAVSIRLPASCLYHV
jgi:hypothetical protein